MDTLAVLSYQNLKMTANPMVVYAEPVVLGVGLSRVDLRYLLDVYVQNAFQSTSFSLYSQHEVTEIPVASGANIGAFFEINRPLHDLLSIPPPTFSNTDITVCDLATRQFYTVLTRKNGTSTVDTVTKSSDWVIRSGVEERDYADYKDSFFSREIGENHRFLTWKPDGTYVSPTQPEYLYFLTNFSPKPQEIRVRVKYYHAGGSDTITAKTLTYVSPMTLYSIPVGFNALGLNTVVSGKTLKYEVWLSNESGERISEVRTYRVDNTYYRSERFLLIQNSLGGYDTIRCVGNRVEALKVSRQVVERFTGYYYLPTMQEQVINRVTGERQLVLNIGNKINETYRRYLEEILFSESFYILDDSDFVPLMPTFDTLVVDNPAEFPIDRQLAFRYSNKSTRYSQLAKINNETRATGWKQNTSSCELSPNGIRTGRRLVNELIKYYLDDDSNVVPLEIKSNVPGTDGYIAPTDDGGCAEATTPYRNTAISAASTFNKQGCGGSLFGSAPIITIDANMYGSEISLADANAKAQAAWNLLNTQDYANTFGACLSPWFYDLVIAANLFNYRINTPATNVGVYRTGEGAGAQGNYSPLVSPSPDPIYAFAAGSNDVKFPTTNQGSSTWQFCVNNNTGVTKTLSYSIYLNGSIMATSSVAMNAGDTTTVNFTTIASQTKVYIEWAWL